MTHAPTAGPERGRKPSGPVIVLKLRPMIDRPAASEELEAMSLLDALARAHMMLRQRTHHEAVEAGLDSLSCASGP